MSQPKQDKVITLRVSRKLRQKLTKYSKKTGLTPSQIIRKNLSEKLKNIK